MTRDPSPPNERRRASDRALGPQSPAVSALASGGVEQPFFRLDISRSFQLHKRLAIGIALTGLALGGL